MEPKVEHHVHESPWAMTGVLVVLAALSAVGGFVPVAHWLEPMLPLPEVPQAVQASQGLLIGVAVVIGFAGLALAAWFFGGEARRAAALRERLSAAHRVLTNKYYIDELYEAVLGRPWQWLSQRVFLQLGDRLLIDGSLHTLAASARRAAAGLGALQAGSLHRYLFYVVLGIAAALWWSVRHG
jgi:NADH-quinone oxidoreductase subunit L